MKKALIFYGGWDGHTPKETAHLFADVLRSEGFEITMSDSLSCLDNYEELKQYDLFIPVWTMGEIGWEQCNNICKAVEEGAGIAGCHGGMCDSFRVSTDWQFMTGSQWVAHPGNDGTDYEVNICHIAPRADGIDNGHYLTDGLADFRRRLTLALGKQIQRDPVLFRSHRPHPQTQHGKDLAQLGKLRAGAVIHQDGSRSHNMIPFCPGRAIQTGRLPSFLFRPVPTPVQCLRSGRRHPQCHRTGAPDRR